jgi:hypothetical protein
MRKIAETGLKAANALAAHTLKVARPLFWHIGVRHGGVPKGASAFILQFEKHFVAVTADHVIEAYLADLAADSRTICQLGTRCRVWPEKSLIARNARLDIATFDISPNLLGDIGAVPIDCRGQWPPPNVEVGDTLTLTGFLDNHRGKVTLNRCDMQAWGGHVIADAVSERDIVTIYEPERMLQQPGPVAKPPLGFNMSGCSGGPAVLIKQINGLLRWFPVGLIYKGPDGKAEGEFAFFDRIHIRRLHFLRSDGTIDEPDIGWLPG